MKPNSKDYIVRRTPDSRNTWSFQIYKSRLEEFSKIEGACLVIICDSGTVGQKSLNIPIQFLEQNVIPEIHCDHRGRFLFEVHKDNFSFNWHHGFKMDGFQFLNSSCN